MSFRLAAGCALSSDQSVSVVPMIQCRPHGNDEQHAHRGPQNDPGRGVNAVARHDQVHALRRPDIDGPAAADHLLDLIGPDTRRVDNLLRPDLNPVPGLQVGGTHAGDALAFAQEAGDLGARCDMRTEAGCRPYQGRDVAGVVHLGVPVDQRPGQR